MQKFDLQNTKILSKYGIFFTEELKKPGKTAEIRIKIRRNRGALIAGTTICL